MTLRASRHFVPVAILTLPLLGLLTAYGCGRGQNAPAVSTPSTKRVIRASTSFSSPAADALASVRVQPLYLQAVQACQGKQYKNASNLLQRLAFQPGLNVLEVAFVQQQRMICLRDAGLPVPRMLPQTTSFSVPVAPLHTTSVALSAAAADCGPRALLLLCQKEGVQADLPHLRQLAGTTKEGTSLSGLEAAAKAVGLHVEGVQVSREALGDIDMPALAYVNGNHFIAVLGVQGQGENAVATVHDPNNSQEQTISQERLLRLCSGYLLLAHR